jgi:hypothetical protein
LPGCRLPHRDGSSPPTKRAARASLPHLLIDTGILPDWRAKAHFILRIGRRKIPSLYATSSVR